MILGKVFGMIWVLMKRVEEHKTIGLVHKSTMDTRKKCSNVEVSVLTKMVRENRYEKKYSLMLSGFMLIVKIVNQILGVSI